MARLDLLDKPGLVFFVLLAALPVIDHLALGGQQVAALRVTLNGRAQQSFQVTKPGTVHVVEIKTALVAAGGEEGRRVRYRVVAPDDTVVLEESEEKARKGRYLRFTPSLPGRHRIELEDAERSGSGTVQAEVLVRAGDRRILPRLLYF